MVLASACVCGSARDQELDRLLDAYAGAVQAEQWDVVLDGLSSARRRSQTPEFLFMAAQQRNRDEYGPLHRVSRTREAVEWVEVPAGETVQRAFLRWEGEQSTAMIAWDLVEDGGKLVVDESWAWPVEGVGTPRVY